MCVQAATCGRCRSELGEAGRVCRHCRMDDVWVGWETRLFRLEARAMGAGGYVSHEDALRQVWRIPSYAIVHATWLCRIVLGDAIRRMPCKMGSSELLTVRA